MRSPGSPSVDAPRREGRILPVEAQTNLRAAQGAGGRTQRLAGTRVPGAAVGLSREKAALDWIVPEAGRERAVTPSQVMIRGARRGIPATGVTRACHLPDPGVVAEAAPAEVADEVAEVADEVAEVEEDAAKRPGTVQPLLNGGDIHDAANQSCKKRIFGETTVDDFHNRPVFHFDDVGPIPGGDCEAANICFP